MPTRVVILGAGFGGLELATRLSDELADEVEVTLIDKSDAFIFGFAKLDVLFGRHTLEEVKLYYRDIDKPSVTFRRETITSIDPVAKRVVTDAGTYDADILVIALGADLDPAATPGFVEGGYEFYSPEGAARLHDVLASFDTGNVVIGVLGGFFKCPPAPYESATMLHDQLTERGVRDNVTITMVTPLAMPIPVSKEASDAILAILDERAITHWPQSQVTHVDPAGKVVHLADGRQLPYDLFIGVPVHRAPAVVVDSGLTDDGWIGVDPATLATRFPDVYAVGDVTSIPVPRAGVMAEGEAATVADVLVARLKGGAAPPPFGGQGICYLDMGNDLVGRVDVSFLTGPDRTAHFSTPSRAFADKKRAFGSTRRARWFGR